MKVVKKRRMEIIKVACGGYRKSKIIGEEECFTKNDSFTIIYLTISFNPITLPEIIIYVLSSQENGK